MTGICGLTGSNEDEVVNAVEKMLEGMAKRGTVTHTVALKASEDQTLCLGVCENSSDLWRVHEKPVDDSVVVDGNFWAKDEVEAVIRNEPKRFDSLIGVPGAFSFLALTQSGLVAGRDVLGQKPLYFGSDEHGRCAFASLKGALVGIGVSNPLPVTPGELWSSETPTPRDSANCKLTRPVEEKLPEEVAVDRIGSLLEEAVLKTVPFHAGVSFSGGIDSSLAACAIKRVRRRVELITVGLESQPELEYASQAAKSIGLELKIRGLTEDEILDALQSVVEIVESNDPMIVSTAIPFYFACREAVELGLDTIVAGQLSDELFGGYARFERQALEGRIDTVGDAMWSSVLAASNNDFEPGDKVAVSVGLELVCPFAYLPLVKYALALPTSLKVRVEGGSVVRKYILRRLAENWNLPQSVVDRPKKAFQYSTGVHKLLAREAKRQGISIGELLNSHVPSRQLYSAPSSQHEM